MADFNNSTVDTNPYKPEYISADDFLAYWGVDLRVTMKNDMGSVDSFLYRREQEIKTCIDSQTFRHYKWRELSPFQLAALKEAMLIQAMYIFRNGEIALDSGYDPDRGIVIQQTDLSNLVICEQAKQKLVNGSLWSKQIKPYNRYSQLFGQGGDDYNPTDYFLAEANPNDER